MKRAVHAILLALIFLPLGCGFISSDVTAISFMLPEEQFRVDTSDLGIDDVGGDEIPSIECPKNDCPSGEAFYCDTEEGLCAAKGTYALTSTLHLAEDVPELANIGESELVDVKFEYLQMEVVENTLNFDLPPLEIYVGPMSIQNMLDEDGNIVDGVEFVGTLKKIPSRATGTFDVEFTIHGEEVLSRYVSKPSEPFHVYVYGTVVFHAGDPVPQGAITLKIHSMVTANANPL